MPWTYSQSTGQIRHNGSFVGHGYSGAGTTATEGRNNPLMQNMPEQGPIPQGQWQIGTAYNDPGNLGPTVMALTPVGHNAFGRTLFRIHGDSTNPANFGHASQGCIILPPNVRQQINNSTDHVLNVVP